MYATKRLSDFKATPEAALQPPPEGPSSGFLVVKEEDPDEEANTCCWGFGPAWSMVRDLPLPHNKILTVNYSWQHRDHFKDYKETVLFVPVIDLPLSANRYYVVVAKGKNKGKVHGCSREDNMITCCFCKCIGDGKPKPFDNRDIYQQMEIIPHKGKFTAKAVASDGIPPWIFNQYWTLYDENKPMNYQLREALGVNKTTRLNYLELNMSASVIAGRWYCPFIFLKEGNALKDQMQRSLFYEVTLEQFWEVYTGNEKKRILLEGKEIMGVEMEPNDGVVWFRKSRDLNGERIGLSLALWERIKWEESKKGWNEGASAMVDEAKFGSSVLVERFSFKRLDGSVVLVFDFIHTEKIRAK